MRLRYGAVWLSACFALSGAELSIPKITLSPGGAAAGGIHYAAQGSQIASLQFDLQYDAANLKISCVAGAAAKAAEKVIGSSDVGPGRKRILLMGFNQSALSDGVVVSLAVSSSSGATGSYQLRLTDAIGADKDANPVRLSTVDGIAEVTSGGEPQGRSNFGLIASGGPWKTTLTLVNPSTAPGQARLNFWAGDGKPLALPLRLPGAGSIALDTVSSFDCSLEPGAISVIETERPDAPEPLLGWTELQGSEEVAGFAVLRSRIGPDRDAEAIVALKQDTGPAFLLPYDEADGFRTGVAIANPSPDSPADLTLLLRDEAGGTITIESLSIPARGLASFTAGERFPVLLGRRGTLELRNGSRNGISVLGLRFNPSGSFTSVPVISK